MAVEVQFALGRNNGSGKEAPAATLRDTRNEALESEPQATTPSARQIIEWAKRVMTYMGDDDEDTEVCVRVVADSESARLNRTYRQRDGSTNVLSFPADLALPESGQKLLGDIAICHPVVVREAVEQRKSLKDHYAHMVVHGMLHLYGHDHVERQQADVMEGIEREILAQVGIGDPYGDQPGSG